MKSSGIVIALVVPIVFCGSGAFAASKHAARPTKVPTKAAGNKAPDVSATGQVQLRQRRHHDPHGQREHLGQGHHQGRRLQWRRLVAEVATEKAATFTAKAAGKGGTITVTLTRTWDKAKDTATSPTVPCGRRRPPHAAHSHAADPDSPHADPADTDAAHPHASPRRRRALAAR